MEIEVAYDNKIRTFTIPRNSADKMKNFYARCDEEFNRPKLFEAANAVPYSELFSNKVLQAQFLDEVNRIKMRENRIDWYDKRLCYEDSDDDLIAVSDDEDFTACDMSFRMNEKNTIRLHIIDDATLKLIIQEKQ